MVDLEAQLNKLWNQYLTEQDDAYIEVINGLIDIRMMHGNNEKVRNILDEVEIYIKKYAYPKDIKQHINAYEEASDELISARSK